MGGDHGPRVTLAACRRFLDSHPDARLLLVGLPEALKDFTHARASVVPASEVVGMDDPIEVALRRKKQSSMRIAIEQVHSGAAQAWALAALHGRLQLPKANATLPSSIATVLLQLKMKQRREPANSKKSLISRRK